MGMQRVARAGLYVGVASVVLGLSKVHAAAHDYDFTASARFGWALVFIVARVLRHVLHRPARPRAQSARMRGWRRSAPRSSPPSRLGRAARCSAARSCLGRSCSAPRSWSCHSAHSPPRPDGTRSRATRTGTASCSSPTSTTPTPSRPSSTMHPERPATLVTSLTIDAARPHDPPDLPLGATPRPIPRRTSSCSVAPPRTTTRSCCRRPLLHEQGIRVRTLSMFYEQWLGKLPVSELERVSLLFDIGEIHAPRVRATEAAARRVAAAASHCPCSSCSCRSC